MTTKVKEILPLKSLFIIVSIMMLFPPNLKSQDSRDFEILYIELSGDWYVVYDQN